MTTSADPPVSGVPERRAPAPRVARELHGQCEDPTAVCEAPTRVSGRRGELTVTNELASELSVTDSERQLVSTYLGDLIRQILLDSE